MNASLIMLTKARKHRTRDRPSRKEDKGVLPAPPRAVYRKSLLSRRSGQNQGVHHRQKEGLACPLGQAEAEKNAPPVAAKNSFNNR